ncbi:TfoX/Sxy family protein [Pseudomonas neustonica]|jgi:DNA transformation protein|uniref:Competence protein TfoX n=1 Tax=Pseudomonas neustonica TaxID=2487346 RepID=A0ABX9XGW7_9PSED|nr:MULTISPECIES: TfoX/Sxy family protein [Pseudomonas]MAB23012.1 competence protein TfoX [Pseudomonadales bacterium]MBA6420061.1 TfoX/Sxy family protein [Pseudomonas sp. 5Ae-yellow]ROZ81844.1 competence protein TfoX [Pseudomonas sp. SSM44]ROZ83687.1 competence protein TfoX [Pseudomonas neustonica]|tara:strand:+ start:9372 stop:9638 length:267 start_codon:yes stop_codon:yes gene_type:complete
MSQDELLTLRNLGKTSAQWLHATGIHNLDELERLGPVGAYTAVRARGFNASKALMFAIAGALQDIHWNDLDPHYKQQLLRQLEDESRP